MKFDLDLLRSRHVLLGMFLGYVFSPPSLSCTSPANGPSNGSKTVKTGQKSRPECEAGASHLRRAPHKVRTRSRRFFAHNSLLVHLIASPFFFNESYDSLLCPPSKKPTQHNTEKYQKHQKLEAIPSF